jgi:hypothetical protein
VNATIATRNHFVERFTSFPPLESGDESHQYPKSTANSVDLEIPLAVVKARLVPGGPERPTPKNQ